MLETSFPGKSLLAIETSTTVARVAVVDTHTGARLAAAQAVAERHSSNLLRLCVETVEAAGLSFAALGAIACDAGPGSFTGLRVGLAVAKGLAMPYEIPLLLVSSLRALAVDMRGAALPGELLLPCLDAGKGQVYAALFEVRDTGGSDGGVVPRGEEWALTPELLVRQLAHATAIVIAGPGAKRYQDTLVDGLGRRARFVEVAGPTADAVAVLARMRLARGESDDLGTAVPSYGRAPDITQPKRRTR